MNAPFEDHRDRHLHDNSRNSIMRRSTITMRPLRLLLVLPLLGIVLGTHDARAQASAQGTPPVQATADAPIQPESLDQLLAPIALYPDALIIQIVTCATSPYQVQQVSAWLDANPDLKGSAVQDAAVAQGFDASVVALSMFPQVVHMMAQQPDWTRDVGQAFAKQRDDVFASIQRLRTQAQQVGNLQSTEQQKVETVATGSGQQVIVIQPANPQVVYVPTYNPQVVYTQPPAPAPAEDDSGKVAAAAVIGFAAGVIVGAVADDDDDHYYYAYGGWGYHGPALCNEGWNDYYDHRENMANDYYDHRENMAGQRGEKQSNRQDTRVDSQGQRQETGGENQGQRQDARAEGQGGRQDTRSEGQAARSGNQSQRQGATAENQATRQGTAGETRESAQANRGTTSSRGAAQAQQRNGTGSGAFSGYQRGSTERASSARGRGSQAGSRSGGASRSGGRR